MLFAEELHDVAIIGGGIVGLAVSRELAIRGNRVLLIEREDAVAGAASSGNSGLLHTGKRVHVCVCVCVCPSPSRPH